MPHLLKEFMPVFCDHIKADRIFLQPRDPHTRVCKVMRWRRNEDIPWPAIPGDHVEDEWFVEDRWELADPLALSFGTETKVGFPGHRILLTV